MKDSEIYETIAWAKANKDRLNSTQLSFLKRFEASLASVANG